MRKNIVIIVLIVLLVCVSFKSFNLYKENIEIKTDKIVNYNQEVSNKNKEDEGIENDETLIYIEELDKEIDTITAQNTITESDEKKLKNIFIKLTDFIFYGEEINGNTFNDLTDEIKEKVINIYETIDEKIENKFPNYKENIKNKGINSYENIKEKLKEVKDSLLSEYKASVGEDNYNIVVESYEDGKENVKEVYNEYKPVIEEGKEKSKDIISQAKEKISNWYNEYKKG